MAKNKRYNFRSGRQSHLLALVFVAVVAVLGTWAIISSLAASTKSSLRTVPIAKWSDSALLGHGLRKPAAGSHCGRLYEVVSAGNPVALGCSHGPDPIPPDVKAKRSVRPLKGAGLSKLLGSSFVPDQKLDGGCIGNGQDGYRVQALYVHGADQPDRSAEFANSFPIYSQLTDDVFLRSSNNTKRIRWVTDAGCNLSVQSVTVAAGTDYSALGNVTSLLQAQGYNSQDRTYLIWLDVGNVNWCGFGFTNDDDRPTPDNVSNTNVYHTGYAMVYSGCWGLPDHPTEAHELIHTMGGVQASAPHHTPKGHCDDGNDVMCYADDSVVVMSYPCPAADSKSFLDCNQDDYFNANPAPGSYLATHWNTASNQLLTGNASLVSFSRLQLRSGKNTDHFYTADASEASSGWDKISGVYGYNLESAIGSIYNGPVDNNPNVVPLYRYWRGGRTLDHYYVLDGNKAASKKYKLQGIAGYIGRINGNTCLDGTKILYGAYNKPASDHFYTTSYQEYRGWRSNKSFSSFTKVGCLW
jgi:hypothetical protein